MGDAGGFDRVFFGRTAAFLVVGLLFLVDGGDGEESTAFVNLTSINSRIVAMEAAGLAGVAAALPWRSCRFCGGFGGG
jgi:hypothetical protein